MLPAFLQRGGNERNAVVGHPMQKPESFSGIYTQWAAFIQVMGAFFDSYTHT